MTIQEALEIVKNKMLYESGVINEALNTVENAVEKQIPKTITFFNRFYIKPYNYECIQTKYKCPCCEYLMCDDLISDGTPNYCPNCGQALDFDCEQDLDFGDLNGIY